MHRYVLLVISDLNGLVLAGLGALATADDRYGTLVSSGRDARLASVLACALLILSAILENLVCLLVLSLVIAAAAKG